MFEKEWDRAESFPDSTPPNRAEKIDEKMIGSSKFFLYKDEHGNCYYQSERQLKYCQEHEKRQKELAKEQERKLRAERSLRHRAQIDAYVKVN